MKLHILRSALGLSLAVLLAACGAGNPTDLPQQTAAMIQTNVQASPAATPGSGAYPAAGIQMASANMPQPDCAADGCKGPRIIDGNAEAFRYAAMQRAGLPQS